MAQIVNASNTQTTPSQSLSPEMCYECTKEIKDYDRVVAIVSGIYWKPPAERVRVQAKPYMYHEDCFYTSQKPIEEPD